MKKDTHPEYHIIDVKMTDGTVVQMKSTWGAEGDTMSLDVDPKSHPAWTGGSRNLIDSGGRIDRFNKRFGGFGVHPDELAQTTIAHELKHAIQYLVNHWAEWGWMPLATLSL